MAAYNSKVLMGNWFEESRLDEMRLKAFQAHKETGTLQHTLHSEKQQHATKPIDIKSNEHVRFGDTVVIQSAFHQGCLATDLSDRILNLDVECYPVTASPNHTEPMARNTFVVEGAEDGPKVGDVLHHGEQFRLRMNSALLETPHYLQSEVVNQACRSHKQRTILYPKKTYETVWRTGVQVPGAERFLQEGTPVAVGTPLVLRHCMSNRLMSTSKEVHENDFGAEFKVLCFTHCPRKKKLTLINEKKGTSTAHTNDRGETAENHWVFAHSGSQ